MLFLLTISSAGLKQSTNHGEMLSPSLSYEGIILPSLPHIDILTARVLGFGVIQRAGLFFFFFRIFAFRSSKLTWVSAQNETTCLCCQLRQSRSLHQSTPSPSQPRLDPLHSMTSGAHVAEAVRAVTGQQSSVLLRTILSQPTFANVLRYFHWSF